MNAQLIRPAEIGSIHHRPLLRKLGHEDAEASGSNRLNSDLFIENQGSVFAFIPLTERAGAWLCACVASESWQWLGGVLVVDHRFARDLAERAVAHGLVIS